MLREWFVKHHGVGTDSQFDLYRCHLCHGLVTHKMILKGGCACAGSRLRPTNPTTWEWFKLMAMPWLMT